MIIKNAAFATIVMTGLAIVGCDSTKKTTGGSQDIPSLKEVYQTDFKIGAALNAQQIEEKEKNAKRLVPQQFNAITPENIMKAEVIHPQWGRYDFKLADKIVEYGRKNGLAVTGHTLIWHSQLPAFVRNMKSADSLRQFFTEHITTIASRYDGKVEGWDVVNEALEEDGTMRKSILFNLLGEDYVVEAFRLAQKAAPNTKLYYNDYNIEETKKRAGAIALIKKIQAAGVRIDGVGIQGHWHAEKVPLKHIEESIIEFSKLGIPVMFTELDLGVLPNPWDANVADVNLTAENNPKMNPYAAGLPDSMQVKLTNGYADLFRLFLKHKDKITRITFWGVNDGQSWLNDWPIRGRTNYPLLFDRNFKPKPAFFKVVEVKKESQQKAF